MGTRCGYNTSFALTDNRIDYEDGVSLTSATSREESGQPLSLSSSFVNTSYPVELSNVHLLPGGGLIANRVNNNEDMIIPDDWSPHEKENSFENNVPKIKVKSFEKLRDPQVYDQCQFVIAGDSNGYEPKGYDDLLSRVVPEDKTTLNVSYFPSITDSYTKEDNIDDQHDLEADLQPFIQITKKPSKILKLKEKENDLKKRLSNIKFIEALYRKKPKSKVNNMNEYQTLSPTNLEPTEYFNFNNNSAGLLHIERESIDPLDCNTDENISVSNINMEDNESTCVNQVISDKNPELTQVNEIREEIDITGLKDGIIEASRSLIETQKTLKFLAQFISSNTLMPNQQAVQVITEFKNTLNIFRKGIDGIDKTVKNQYKHLFPNNDLDSLLQSIKISMVEKKHETKKWKKKVPSDEKHKTEKTKMTVPFVEKHKTEKTKMTVPFVEKHKTEKTKMTAPFVKKHKMKKTKMTVPFVKKHKTEKCKKKVPSGRPRGRPRKQTNPDFLVDGVPSNIETVSKRVVPFRTCRSWQDKILEDDEEFEFENS